MMSNATKQKMESALASPIPARFEVPKTPDVFEEPDDKHHLDLGAGYRVPHRPGSGYSAFLRILAQESKFGECARMLSVEPCVQADDAKKLLEMMMVPVSRVLDLMSKDPEFLGYCERKTRRLQEAAGGGDQQAREVLDDSRRADGNGNWRGNLQEIISTCKGVYTSRNKNVKKYRDAGILIRQFPIDVKSNNDTKLMMFPIVHAEAVTKLIRLAFGVKESLPAVVVEAMRQGKRRMA